MDGFVCVRDVVVAVGWLLLDRPPCQKPGSGQAWQAEAGSRHFVWLLSVTTSTRGPCVGKDTAVFFLNRTYSRESTVTLHQLFCCASQKL